MAHAEANRCMVPRESCPYTSAGTRGGRKVIAPYTHRSERSRKNERTILQHLARHGQNVVAEKMGISESKVSRFKNGELAEMAGFLAAIGLKVVPEEVKCFEPKKIDAILELAKAHLNQIECSSGLSFEDEAPDG